MLGGKNPEAVRYETMVDYKIDLCQVLAPHASAVLLDPVYGVRQAIATGALPGDTGFLVSLEDTEYESTNEGRITKLLPDWGVEQIKRLGASAAKLLLYYRITALTCQVLRQNSWILLEGLPTIAKKRTLLS